VRWEHAYTIGSQAQQCIGKASRGQLAMNLLPTVLRQGISKLKEQSAKFTKLEHVSPSQAHIDQITNLQGIKLHVGIPVGQSLDHCSNGFFRTIPWQIAISKTSCNALIPNNPHTLIPQNQPCHKHPISKRRISSTSSRIGEVALLGFATHQNIFPVF
jgi:hypothetical protein